MGVKKDYRSYFPGNTHMIIVMPSLDPDENFKPMRDGDINKVQFGITNYSKADPAIAPKGKNVISMVTLMPYDMNNGWKENESNEAYQKFKRQVADVLIKRAEKYLPGLSKNIEEIEIGTPRTNMHFTSNRSGSIYGWAHSDEQSLMNRLPQETPIKNLLLAGAWTYPAGGQTPVLFSGYTAGGKVLDELD
jgi:phytoene dehydrogenase-like protein